MERKTRSRIFETILKENLSQRETSSHGENSGASLASNPRPSALASSGVSPVHLAPASSGSAPSEYEAATERAQRAEQHGDYQTAATEYLRAIVSSGAPHVAQQDRVHLYLSLGRCQQRQQHFPEARLALQHAQHVIDASRDPATFQCEQVELDAHLGSLAFAEGDITEAEEHLISAINRYEQSCTIDPKRLARLYTTLSSIYTEASFADHALDLALKGLSFLEQCTEEVNWEKMRMFQLLATIACKRADREAAVGYLLQAYHFAGLLSSQQDLVELEVLLATVYSQYEQDREACAWCEAAIRRQELTGQQAQWPLSLLYLCLGQLQARSLPEQAPGTFHRSLDLQLSHLYLDPSP